MRKRLFLPEGWCDDKKRCDKAGVPQDCQDYKKHAQLALELIDDADDQGLEYAWIGMDAEFGAPWFLDTLDRRGKLFLIDVPSNAHVFKTNPQLSYCPKKLSKSKLRLSRKSLTVKDLRLLHGNRRWRRVEIRDSSKGLMTVEFLHKKIWFWDKKNGGKPAHWHLIIRRTPKENGSDWVYKYSLSNAPLQTSTRRLAYQ